MDAKSEDPGRRDLLTAQGRDAREVRVFDPITGKRRSAYAKTEAAARKKLREMVTRKESGEIVLDRGTSFEDYSQKWLAGEGLKGRRRVHRS